MRRPTQSVLCLAVLLLSCGAIASAQPPGFPGGRMPGAPGAMPGAPGMPGMPAGMPGAPNIPTPPTMPTMPAMPEMPEHRIPDFPSGPMFEHVYTCSNCGKEIGRGQIRPEVANCPHCGTRFNNTAAGMMANTTDQMNSLRNRTSSAQSAAKAGAITGMVVGGIIILGVGAVGLAGVIAVIVVIVKLVSAAAAPPKKSGGRKSGRRRPAMYDD